MSEPISVYKIKTAITKRVIITKTMLALLALCVANIAISFSGIFVRLSENEIGPSATVFSRFWIVAIVIGLVTPFQSKQETGELSNISESPPKRLFLVGVGVSYALSQICWAWSFSHTTVTISTLLYNLAPLFVCLGSWLWLGQSYNRQFIAGLFVATFGCFVIGWSDLQSATLQWQGDAAAVMGGIFYALYILLVKQLRPTVSATTILLSVSVLGSIVCLPFVLIGQEHLFPISLQGWLFVIGLALICQGLGQGLIAYSLEHLSSGLVSLSHLSEPVLTGLLAWLIFLEHLTWYTGSAFILIMIGLYLAVSSSSSQG
ncbi:DMT family transporter [Dapis sp. BLCC M229]|uniref:DMT family transporter n=1 Tax=Dapis sp. BLCC M229 TaxID=3400188 RepID=UPI003CE869B4